MLNLSPVQQKLLQMLKWFDEYCAEHNIRYYVAGGTLLGAIRHNGFIPWDDDIDVIVPRSDYKKLIKLLTEKQGDYILETPYSGNNDFLYSFSKIYDTSTTLLENTRYPCKRGLYIDVFPLDGIGTTYEESQKHFATFDKWNMFLMTRTCAIRKGRSFYKNFSIALSRLIPKFIINDKKLSIKVDILASNYNFDDSDYVANLMGNYRSKEIIKKSILGQPKRYRFENIYVNGAEDYEAYLTHIYGDWRQLPPKEKQKSHHDFLEMDINKPYIIDKIDLRNN